MRANREVHPEHDRDPNPLALIAYRQIRDAAPPRAITRALKWIAAHLDDDGRYSGSIRAVTTGARCSRRTVQHAVDYAHAVALIHGIEQMRVASAASWNRPNVLHWSPEWRSTPATLTYAEWFCTRNLRVQIAPVTRGGAIAPVICTRYVPEVQAPGSGAPNGACMPAASPVAADAARQAGDAASGTVNHGTTVDGTEPEKAAGGVLVFPARDRSQEQPAPADRLAKMVSTLERIRPGVEALQAHLWRETERDRDAMDRLIEDAITGEDAITWPLPDDRPAGRLLEDLSHLRDRGLPAPLVAEVAIMMRRVEAVEAIADAPVTEERERRERLERELQTTTAALTDAQERLAIAMEDPETAGRLHAVAREQTLREQAELRHTSVVEDNQSLRRQNRRLEREIEKLRDGCTDGEVRRLRAKLEAYERHYRSDMRADAMRRKAVFRVDDEERTA